MIRQESGFNPNAKSGAGAQGIAQFMPGTAPGYGVNLHDGRVTDDLEGAAKYIAANLKRTGGNYHEALSIYNSGRPDAYKDPGFASGQTFNYVKTILGGAGHEKTSTGSGNAPQAASSRSVTSSKTVGAVDNSAARGALIRSFLDNGNPTVTAGTGAQGFETRDPLQFALGVKQLQDDPGTKVTTTKTVKGKTSSYTPPKGQGMSPLKELFWQGKNGIDAKNGVKVPQGFVSGHTDHVHVAAGPKTVIQLGKLAQSLGLHVGENPYFTGKDPAPGVHTGTSNHYKIKLVGGKKVGEAIDVSGDPKAMAHYAAVVAHRYGLKVHG
jgi:hypothetical protein